MLYPGYQIKICDACNFAYNELEDIGTCPHPKRRTIAQEHNAEIKRLFHKLWSKDVGTAGYDKRDWMELQRRLQARGIEV
jgi:hypothetical protein